MAAIGALPRGCCWPFSDGRLQRRASWSSTVAVRPTRSVKSLRSSRSRYCTQCRRGAACRGCLNGACAPSGRPARGHLIVAIHFEVRGPASCRQKSAVDPQDGSPQYSGSRDETPSICWRYWEGEEWKHLNRPIQQARWNGEIVWRVAARIRPRALRRCV